MKTDNTPAKAAAATAKLAAPEIEAVEYFYQASLAGSTVEAYASALNQYTTWAKARGLELYATGTIAGYLADRAKASKAVSTITKDFAAIKHFMKSAPDNIRHSIEYDKLSVIMAGIARSQASRVRIQKRAATADIIKLMTAKPANTIRDKRNRALLLVGFALMSRRSELIALTVENLKKVKGGYYVTIQHSKTDQTGQGFIKFLPESDSPFCPATALRAWLKAANITQGLIFRRVYKTGEVSDGGITSQTIALVIKELAAAAGQDPAIFAGHSLRRGAITTASESGASLPAIMGQSGHKTAQIVLSYIDTTNKAKNYPLKGVL